MVDKEIEDFTSEHQEGDWNSSAPTEVLTLGIYSNMEKRLACPQLLHVVKETVNSLLTHFFLEIWEQKKGKENEEYEPGTLTTYRNALRKYFLDRPEAEGGRFDIGEDQDLKKKLSSKRKQLKAIGKGNRQITVIHMTRDKWGSCVKCGNWLENASSTFTSHVVEYHSHVGNAGNVRTPWLQTPRGGGGEGAPI